MKCKEKGSLSEHVAQRWCQRFKPGGGNTKDLTCAAGLKIWDSGRKSTKKVLYKLSEELGASKDTIHRQIKTLGKTKQKL